MKIFISQKMRDLDKEEILKRRQMITDLISKDENYKEIEIIESWHEDFNKNSVYQLGQSIGELSEADLILISKSSLMNIVSFVNDVSTEKLKGSEIEVLISMSYGIPYKTYKLVLDEKGSILEVEWYNSDTDIS